MVFKFGIEIVYALFQFFFNFFIVVSASQKFFHKAYHIGSHCVIRFSFGSFFDIFEGISIFTYDFAYGFIGEISSFDKLLIESLSAFRFRGFFFVLFFSTGIIRIFSIFSFVDTGHFGIFLSDITEEVPSVNIVYIAVVIVVFAVVRNFGSVCPDHIFKIFVIDIYTRIYHPYDDFFRSKIF